MTIRYQQITTAEYAKLFKLYGGSFSCSPELILLLKKLSQKLLEIRGIFEGEILVAAFPLIDGMLITSQKSLKFLGIENQIDIGQPEFVPPSKIGICFELPVKAKFISVLNQHKIVNCVPNKSLRFAIAKDIEFGTERFSKSTLKNRRYELKKLIKLGFKFVPVQELSTEFLVNEYGRLYRNLRNTDPVGYAKMKSNITTLRHYLVGDVLMLNENAVAIQILYRTNDETHDYINYVNSAYDEAFNHLSIGSSILFHNISSLERHAIINKRLLRFCMGKLQPGYKVNWSKKTNEYNSLKVNQSLFRINSVTSWIRKVLKS